MTPLHETYRPEIDGLRAIAILPVLLFHAGVGPFSGGFVGVDVFFVISGFLITRNLLSDMDGGQFSLVRFYERRARRILPALYVVMAVSSLAAWFLMLPEQLANFGQSVVATVLFANNVLLTLTAGYWDVSLAFKPLFHTWSLGIEEQFYVAFPVLLFGLSAVLPMRRVFWILAALLVMSFALTLPAHQWNPIASFYLVVTRGWELLAGALAAFLLRRRRAPASSQALSLIGLGTILAATILLDETTVFPGPAALLPVSGTVLVILFAGPGTLAHRVLGLRPMVAIGLISYSLYLWHQPLIAFVRISSRDEPGQWAYGLALVAAFAFAWVSWKFVEQRFRSRSRVSTKAFWGSAIGGGAVLLLVGALFHITDGFPSRLHGGRAPASVDHIAYNERAFQLSQSRFPVASGRKILLIGNSFGRDVSNVLVEYFDPEEINLVYRHDMRGCLGKVTDPTMASLISDAEIVIVTSPGLKPSCVVDDVRFIEQGGAELVYVGSKNFGYNLNWIMQTHPRERASLSNRPTREWAATEGVIRAAVPPANYLSIYDAIRTGDAVPVTDEQGDLVSADTIHLTRAGARLVGARMLPGSRLEAAIRRPGP